jgi:hypothetical protein
MRIVSVRTSLAAFDAQYLAMRGFLNSSHLQHVHYCATAVSGARSVRGECYDGGLHRILGPYYLKIAIGIGIDHSPLMHVFSRVTPLIYFPSS